MFLEVKAYAEAAWCTNVTQRERPTSPLCAFLYPLLSRVLRPTRLQPTATTTVRSSHRMKQHDNLVSWTNSVTSGFSASSFFVGISHPPLDRVSLNCLFHSFITKSHVLIVCLIHSPAAGSHVLNCLIHSPVAGSRKSYIVWYTHQPLDRVSLVLFDSLTCRWIA
jgi:hypothetical protein